MIFLSLRGIPPLDILAVGILLEGHRIHGIQFRLGSNNSAVSSSPFYP